MSQSNQGKPAISSRIAFGSLVIQSMEDLRDRKLVQQISENPYLQCFLGYKTYFRETEKEENIILPRRGTIHDLGPTFTHKVFILKKLKLEHKSVEQTCRETYHSKEAVNRYLKDFESIEFLYKKNFSIEDIQKSTRKSFALIQEYINIIDNIMEVKKNA